MKNGEMKLSKIAEQEMRKYSRSTAFKNEMDVVAGGRHNSFIRDGVADVDAYVEFVSSFNEFIGHRPKPFVSMSGSDMRL